jgi:hypothetical protein
LRTKILSYNQKENDEFPSYDRDCVMRGCIGKLGGVGDWGIGRKVTTDSPNYTTAIAQATMRYQGVGFSIA